MHTNQQTRGSKKERERERDKKNQRSLPMPPSSPTESPRKRPPSSLQFGTHKRSEGKRKSRAITPAKPPAPPPHAISVTDAYRFCE
ncbi:hypothetical protein RHMOL_Rhmol05G0029400 [Rhododendron molle]|uniref:Uncharacterized protein n=1 Tax=Rhododendron molle TaxID=49168 RepID=A0ACC0NM96_RHOML|nr:hypothetical protein RHMOL_Rhmol05G0029400 [Rhododendron molle]